MVDKIYADSETGCCKRFDPKPWHKKEITFRNRLFLKDTVISIFHIPLNFEQVMVKNVDKIVNAKALVKDPLMLADSGSLFGMNIYIAVSKNVPDAKMVKISGKYLTKVYEGDFESMGKWIEDITAYVKSKGKVMKKMYFFYTTCPACAKVYGRNYTVILAEI